MMHCYRCHNWPCICEDGATLIHGDCLEVLQHLPPASVQCVVTSPPYFALRSYLDKADPLKVKEIGSEPTPEAFIATMVDVFREVRRVLRDDGVCFVNLGDSYSSDTKWGGMSSDKHNRAGMAVERPERYHGAPLGNLLNIPHRVAAALQADGWIWRQTIVWAKKSPMPESVSGWKWVQCKVKVAGTGWKSEDRPEVQFGDQTKTKSLCYGTAGGVVAAPSAAKWIDCPGCPKCEAHGGYVLRRGSGRCTTGHEYVFLFAKSQGYFWDQHASQESATNAGKPQKMADGWDTGTGGHGTIHRDGRERGRQNGFCAETRNMRSIWTISSEPTKERHFATFPSELVRRCLSAGVSHGGCCPTCGAPWAPVLSSERVRTRPALANKIWKHDDGDHVGQRSDDSPNLDPERHIAVTQCHGYRQTCDCPAHEPIGCMVLDPFAGLATVGQTARHLGCRSIGIDLNAKYLDVAAKRVAEPPRWWLRQQKPKAKKAKRKPHKAERLLF